MFQVTEEQSMDRKSNKARKIFSGLVGAIAVSLLLSFPLVHFADAAPNLPKSNSKDSIQGWCGENGGTFSDMGHLWACVLPDGTLVLCERLDAQTVVCSKSNPDPASKPNSPKTALTTLAVDAINVQKTQQEILTRLNDLTTKVATLISGQNALANQVNGLELACTTPDLLPMPTPGTAGPEGFCQRDIEGKLHIKIYNQGGADAPASTTVVSFLPGVQNALTGIINLQTPALLAFGGSTELVVDIPSTCFNPTTGNCNFNIGADLNNVVAEGDEANNSVKGVCGPFLL